MVYIEIADILGFSEARSFHRRLNLGLLMLPRNIEYTTPKPNIILAKNDPK